MDWLQILVITVVVIGSGLLIAALVQNFTFRRNVKKETALLLQACAHEPVIQLNEERLQQLPPPVLRWLRLTRSLDAGKPIQSVRIRQEGMLRTKPEGGWMPFRAKQYSLLDQPSFIWKARIRAAPGVAIYGRDLYLNGQADMLIKLMGVFKVGHARGREIDQGSLVRYLAEMVWYPTAALSPYITWEAVADDVARANISYGGINASGTFYFQKTGEPVRFMAQRFKEDRETCTMEEWEVRMGTYKPFQGIFIPSQGEICWNLQAGPFHWFRFEVKEAEFNPVLK
ncbi:DUF6544 family protein [Paenibacillus phocaensis]|uniref:DUF6544 family protein n=1 Tax=Paenibacillus phocaensis TaxID=1776378 RepID=UPI000839D489|nr:DUF6544 family protein [Paenibacillus phocaensis]